MKLFKIRHILYHLDIFSSFNVVCLIYMNLIYNVISQCIHKYYNKKKKKKKKKKSLNVFFVFFYCLFIVKKILMLDY